METEQSPAECIAATLNESSAVVVAATEYSTLAEMLSTTARSTDRDCGCASASDSASDEHALDQAIDALHGEGASAALEEALLTGEVFGEEDEQDAPTESLPASARWEGPIGMEGEFTGDGRLIENNALRWEDLPLPMRYVSADVGMHDGAVVVGTIDTLERRDGGMIWGSGPFDMGSEVGREAFRQVRDGYTTGVSMDLDDVSFEVRVAAELLEGMDALLNEDGEIEVPEPDEDGRITVATINSDDEVRVTTSGRVRAATIVAIPAFAKARIGISETSDAAADVETPDDGDDELATSDSTASLVAAGARLAPLNPPQAWFENPNLSGPTPLTITKDGRVYGHIALWGTCHTGMSHNGTCITPPRSATNYSSFHYGALVTAEGAEIAVGHITMGTGHADERLGSAAALAHYDNTGTAVADVRAYEDQFGVAIAGALDPAITPEKLRRFRSSPVSGDWRRQGTGLELVAALAVNMPGFPVPRPSGLVASGAVQSLVAAGMVPPRRVKRPGTPGALSVDDLRYLKRLADRERADEQRERLDSAAELAKRVRASVFATRRESIKNKIDAFAAQRATERED